MNTTFPSIALHCITNDMMKLRVGVLYLDREGCQLWKWHKKANVDYIARSQFMNAIYDRFDRDTHYLDRLTRFHQIGTVTEFIVFFKQLAIHTKDLNDSLSEMFYY